MPEATPAKNALLFSQTKTTVNDTERTTNRREWKHEIRYGYKRSEYRGTTFTTFYYYYQSTKSRRLPSGPWNDEAGRWPTGNTHTPTRVLPQVIGPTTQSPQEKYKWKPKKSSGQTATEIAVKAGLVEDLSSATDGLKFVAAKGNVRFNPPLHRFSIGVKPPFEPSYVRESRMGRIYSPEKVWATKASAYNKRWGFRFLYNPTYWGYEMQTNLDTTVEQITNTALAAQPPLPGTQQFKLSLYLNRIADLKTKSASTKYYNPTISKTDLEGIKRWGTEWDLEYLYRVINGNPQQIVTGSKTPRTSANIGFLVFQRVAIRLAKGAFFYGVIDAISVDHVMMTQDMIPTFTKVDLDISVYPQLKQVKPK